VKYNGYIVAYYNSTLVCCRPSLNDDSILGATLYTAGGVGEVYKQRSALL
jgi:hypothetical protein